MVCLLQEDLRSKTPSIINKSSVMMVYGKTIIAIIMQITLAIIPRFIKNMSEYIS